MAKIKDIEPERMDYLVGLARKITTPPGGIRMKTPPEVDQDHSILKADDALERLIDTTWPLEIHSGERADLTFTELMVLMHQIEAMKEQFENAQRIVKKKKMRGAKVQFDINFRVDQVMTPENVRRLLDLLQIDENQEPSSGRIEAIPVDPKYTEYSPERFNRVLEIVQVALSPGGEFKIYPPAEVLADRSILDANDVVERLHGTTWQLHLANGRVEEVEFIDLMVIVQNMLAFQETRKREEQNLIAKGVKRAKVQFTTNSNLDEIMQTDSVRALLRRVRLEFALPHDADAPEPKLTEIFSDARMNKCTAVWQRVLNNWISTKVFECRIVADEKLEGKSLKELGKSYLSIGVGDGLTRLPFMDALVVMDMLKQYNINLQENETQLERFQIKTEYTQSEVFGLLDEIRRAGIRIEVIPLE